MKEITRVIRAPNEYIAKIMDLFPYMKYETIVAQKHIYKTTYKKLYKDYLKRYETIHLAQEKLAEYEAKHLKNFKVFKGKSSSATTHFLTAVFSSRDSVPSRPFINKINKVLAEIEELEDL